MSPTPVLQTSTSAERESQLRSRLANVLEEARGGLARLPILDGHTSSDEAHSAQVLIAALSDLLADALLVNADLRELPDLSIDSALCCGAVTIAVSAVTDALSVVQAQLDSRAA